MTKKQAATQARTVLVQRGDYVLLEIYEKTIQAMRARVHQLQDMLASVGAGGVEPIKPQPREIPFSLLPGERQTILRMLKWYGQAFKESKRNEMEFAQDDLFFYVNFIMGIRSELGAGTLERQPQGKPPTDDQIELLAHRTCLNHRHSPDSSLGNTYTFNRHTLLNFARALGEGGTA